MFRGSLQVATVGRFVQNKDVFGALFLLILLNGFRGPLSRLVSASTRSVITCIAGENRGEKVALAVNRTSAMFRRQTDPAASDYLAMSRAWPAADENPSLRRFC
ncbi:unnamed protein product [Heligmosomoides polygyrus]|uniref:ABC transmembrane type-1 domain-containing protein n=1 Tax=Heligmosomoides polygyrus TaxID=6339 RepID=A0A183GKH9_HELPZ|nr:unnamed protein product [Heligmosomoides polygyrus]